MMSRLQRWLRKLGSRAKKRRRSVYVDDQQRQQQLRYEEWQRGYEEWRQAQGLSSPWPSMHKHTQTSQKDVEEEDGFSDNFVCEDDHKARFSEPEDIVAGPRADQQELRRRRRISGPEFAQVPQKNRATASDNSKTAKAHRRHRRAGQTVSLSGAPTRTALPSTMDYYTLTSITNSWGMVPIVTKRSGEGRGTMSDEYSTSLGIFPGEETSPLLFMRAQSSQKRTMSFTYGELEQDNDEIELTSFQTVAAS